MLNIFILLIASSSLGAKTERQAWATGMENPLSRTLNFPLFGVAWTDEETIAVAGGGGSTKSGVKNR